MTPLDGLARHMLTGRLARIRSGRVVLEDGGPTRSFGAGAPAARLTVRDPRFYRAVAFGGHLGAVEAYLDAWWTTDDLTALALDTGFSSHSHFTAVFRRTFGSTPSAFRQASRRTQRMRVKARLDRTA